MTTVIKLGGNVCDDGAALDVLADAWQEHGDDPWLVVHGGGPQLDAALATFGPPQRIDGLRVTPPEHMERIRQVLDDVGGGLVQALVQRGVQVTHLPSHWALLHGEPKGAGAHLGRVGTPTAFDADVFARLVPPGHLVVVSPVAWDAQGPLNINADEAASAIALSIAARRLFIATSVPHVVDGSGAAIAHLDADAAGQLITTAAARDGMVPKLRAALHALQAGVPEVVIGAMHGLADGSGTRIAQVVMQ